VADALCFANRVSAERVLLFHHDPLHSDDFLDDLCGEVGRRWQELGGEAEQVEMATERREIALADHATPAV
jgi:phosphoribosyl 1,2-cyclic phosphodiesterase